MKTTSILFGNCLRGRLAAPLVLAASVLIGGCSTLEQSQLGQTAGALLSHDQFDAEQARALPYASLRFEYDGNIGMLVLASLDSVKIMPALSGASASPETTSDVVGSATIGTANEFARFETADHAFIRLENGLLSGTAGFANDLLDMQRDSELRLLLTQDSASSHAQHTYRVHSRWQLVTGGQGYAEGTASWQCDAPDMMALPLGEQRVSQCSESIHWDDGEESLNHFAVAVAQSRAKVDITSGTAGEANMPSLSQASPHPSSQLLHIWAADIQPWPGGPRWSWEVARAWW